MTSDVTVPPVSDPPAGSDELTVYKRLYRQALAQIEELQEKSVLLQSLIQQYEEFSAVLQEKLQELERNFSECEDRLKSEQKRSAQFRLALERCQTTEVKEEPAPEPTIEAWAVVENVAPPPENILSPKPPNTYQKRSIDSLAAVQLPQFPSLRQR